MAALMCVSGTNAKGAAAIGEDFEARPTRFHRMWLRMFPLQLRLATGQVGCLVCAFDQASARRIYNAALSDAAYC